MLQWPNVQIWRLTLMLSTSFWWHFVHPAPPLWAASHFDTSVVKCALSYWLAALQHIVCNHSTWWHATALLYNMSFTRLHMVCFAPKKHIEIAIAWAIDLPSWTMFDVACAIAKVDCFFFFIPTWLHYLITIPTDILVDTIIYQNKPIAQVQLIDHTCMTSTNHICISLRTLTPKLNPSGLAAEKCP